MAGDERSPAPAGSAPGHVPVLRERVLALVAPALERPGSVLVDATLGLGGHAEAVLQRVPQARVVGIDRDPDALASAAGPAEAFLRSTLRTTTNPTVLTAGYKHNVIPERAEALIDVRVIPGTEDDVLAELQRIVGDDIVIDLPDGRQEIYCGREGRAEAIRDGVLGVR